jgi:hypothetical protein
LRALARRVKRPERGRSLSRKGSRRSGRPSRSRGHADSSADTVAGGARRRTIAADRLQFGDGRREPRARDRCPGKRDQGAEQQEGEPRPVLAPPEVRQPVTRTSDPNSVSTSNRKRRARPR